MERVLILGSPGAGKSTLASKLGACTGLPVIHLNMLYWRPGWSESDAAEFRAKVATVVRDTRWIIDGDYGSTLGLRLSRGRRDRPRRVALPLPLAYSEATLPLLASRPARHDDWLP